MASRAGPPGHTPGAHSPPRSTVASRHGIRTPQRDTLADCPVSAPILPDDEYLEYDVPLAGSSSHANSDPNREDTLAVFARLETENERLRREMVALRHDLAAARDPRHRTAQPGLTSRRTTAFEGGRPTRTESRHGEERDYRPPTPESPIDSRRRFKAEVLGELDPSSPEAFLSSLMAERFFWPERDLINGLRSVLAKSSDPQVTDWYRAELTTRIQDGTFRDMLLDDWVAAIRTQFGRTSREKRLLLRDLRLRASENMGAFVARARRTCTEAGVLSDAAQIDEIVDRLPESYLPGLTPTHFRTVSELLQELKIREKVLKRQPEYSKRNEAPADRKRSSTTTPYGRDYRGEREPSSSKGKERSRPPCPKCNHKHWLKGSNAEVCETCGCCESTPGPQKKVKREAYSVQQVGSDYDNDLVEDLEDYESIDDDSCPSSGSSQDHPICAFVEPHDITAQAYPVALATSSQGVVYANTLGPLPSATSFQHYSPYLVQAGLGETDVRGWYVLDSGSPLSFVALDMLKNTTYTIERKDRALDLDGIAAGATVTSTHGVQAEIRLPMRGGKEVSIKVYLHVLPTLPIGLLLGNDVAVPNKISTNPESNTFTIGSAYHMTGDLRTIKTEASGRSVTIPIRCPRSLTIAPTSSHKLHTGHSIAGQKVVSDVPGLRLQPRGSAVKITNVSDSPIKLTTGQEIGSATSFDTVALLASSSPNHPFRQ